MSERKQMFETEAILNLFKNVMITSIHDLENSVKDVYEKNGAVAKYKQILSDIKSGIVVKNKNKKPYKKEQVERLIYYYYADYLDNHNFFYSNWCKQLCEYIELDYSFLIVNLKRRKLLKDEPIIWEKSWGCLNNNLEKEVEIEELL